MEGQRGGVSACAKPKISRDAENGACKMRVKPPCHANSTPPTRTIISFNRNSPLLEPPRTPPCNTPSENRPKWAFRPNVRFSPQTLRCDTTAAPRLSVRILNFALGRILPRRPMRKLLPKAVILKSSEFLLPKEKFLISKSPRANPADIPAPRRRSQTRASDGRPALKSAPQRRIPPTRQAPERADQKDAPCAAEGLSKAPPPGRFSELRAPHSARYCPAAHTPPGADSPEPFAMPLFKEKNVFSSREHSSSSTPPSTAREWLRVGRS